MDKNLEQLIIEYQTRVREAVALMYRSGVAMPYSSFAWMKSDIPMHGILDGGVEYFKHGAGCLVQLETGEIDFDFGDDGEIDGFDLWRLTRFMGGRLPRFGFASAEQIEQSFSDAVDSGKLNSEGGLYYLTDTPRMFAVDIDSTRPGDILPSKNHDKVLTLYAHYFEAADLMRENFEKLDAKWRKAGKLSRNDEIQNRIYFFSWVGFLAVTCEGFKNANMHLLLSKNRPERFKDLLPLSNALGRMINTHWDPLREFRNNVFHLRESPEKIRKFFSKEADRLSWALELHDTLKRFFTDYRIQCTVHYAMNRRKGEIDIERGRTRHTFQA
ncbi:DUF6896 domain-containing protein [Pseudoduganella violacea]|uniref:DUF6896 domain-containing protein n=1 Tax=Pseudoduganella violacea TaxID=1715466 RepID=A0A7W5B920_9BURK|nr:hypothetical protein [Pseudoduganella violacea]MBB3118797.1 hypothetical protein [Pseudoduganella violacea]